MGRFLPLIVVSFFSAFFWVGCGDIAPRVVEEQEDGPLRFERVRMEKDVRRGAELGLRVWARIEDGREVPESYHLRFALRDSLLKPHLGNYLVQGRTLVPVRDPELGDTLCWEYEPSMVASEVKKFDVPDLEMPPAVEFFLPYHWLRLDPGYHKVYLDLEAAEGELPEESEDGFPGQWEESRSRAMLGYMRVELEMDLPHLYPLRVVVSDMELDTLAFDPHAMDFVLIPIGDRYGFPDLYWSLGIGYENAFNSDYYHNSVSGEWPEGSGTIYVRGKDESVSLCAIDWDDERVMNNRHDEIGCWEGKLSDLSQDSAHPSLLRFENVKRMAVYVDWLEEN